MNEPTAHALLRDRRSWSGTLAGLVIDGDGALQLARVPAPARGKAIDIPTTYPYVREVSGLALGPNNAVFVADTAHHRVLFEDGLCNTKTWLPHRVLPLTDAPGHFHSPRGLALTTTALWVADSGHQRAQGLALPTLDAHLSWPWRASSIAVDSQDRLLWVDAVNQRVHRHGPHGTVDAAFEATLLAQGPLPGPLFVAVGSDDAVFVCDSVLNEVHVFDDQGVFLHQLPGPAGWLPGAVACQGTRVYVADAATGQIHAFDSAIYIGAVHGWRGPVTALAVHANGDLVVKTGLDAVYHRLIGSAAFVPHGELTAGPFDAGEERVWERVWVEAQMNANTAVLLDVAFQATEPTAAQWKSLPCADALLSPLGASRYVWMRVHLQSRSPQETPRLTQARCATAAENLLDFLPQTYQRHDADGFLERWLQLLRGEFGRVEELLDDMPRVADPTFEPASQLPWLAQWLALELPKVATDDERRALMQRAYSLFARRGSKASIAEFCELHTGVRPALIEAFTDRHVWVLGSSSRLDFDTCLAVLDPNGWVVPDESDGDGCCPPMNEVDAACSPCQSNSQETVATVTAGPIGRAIVGEGGPLGESQTGLPLYADAAYRFCVVVDSHRVHNPALLDELRRIVDREKPAHTDYRIEHVQADMRVGLQMRIGIDTIVGGDAPPWRADLATLGLNTQLPPPDRARFGDAVLDGTLTLS
jgi:phage tail-like protein